MRVIYKITQNLKNNKNFDNFELVNTYITWNYEL